jgi:hypothetical protein
MLVYNEPTTNADNTPLIDLDHINIYQNRIKYSTTFPVTSPIGGGKNISILINPIFFNHIITLYLTAVDKFGNESMPSKSVQIKVLKK